MKYLKDFCVMDELKGKSIIIYGAGHDGKMFYDRYHNSLQMKYYIDKTYKDADLPVYKLEDVESEIQDEIIVICSLKFYEEIVEELEKNKLLVKAKKYVWLPYYDENINDIVKLNKKLWTGAKRRSERKVLVPIANVHEMSVISFAYFSNYFAEKYDAEIVAYIRGSGTSLHTKIMKSVLDIYNSFNVAEYTDISKEYVDKKLADEIFDRIIKNIKEMDDWTKIEINGLDCGISFMRDYQRFYELSLNPLSSDIKKALKNAIKKVLFWQDYIKSNNVCCVIMWDGVHEESYLRDIAIKNGVPVYILYPSLPRKTFFNLSREREYVNYKNRFAFLSNKEKVLGIKWAKKELTKVLQGASGADYRGPHDFSVYNNETKSLRLDMFQENKRVKIVICPHIFDEDAWSLGRQVCGNNYLSWLTYLGEMSCKTDYDWYIKIHPDENERGNRLIRQFVNKYNNIKLLDRAVSPIDMKEKGVRYALTIGGSIGHEYPLFGINVINGGSNPHMSFGFNINPKTFDEYHKTIENIDSFDALENKDEVYEYYCIEYLYNKGNDFYFELNEIFRGLIDRYPADSTQVYRKYIDMLDENIHKDILDKIPKFIEMIDNWSPEKFTKRSKKEIVSILSRSGMQNEYIEKC